MRRGITLIEICVIISILAILAGMILPAINMIKQSADKARMEANKGTVETNDTWKVSENKTPSSDIKTFIITDPTNNQKWIVVTRNSNNVAIIPYVPAEVKAEKETK